MLDPDNASQMADLDTILKNIKETGYINGRASRLPWMAALLAIRDMPIPEQDNMLSANMRKIAADALAASGSAIGPIGSNQHDCEPQSAQGDGSDRAKPVTPNGEMEQ